MVVEFVPGEAKQYVATRDFALNFDDPKKTPSVKIREGQVILYDGINATYSKDGAIINGRCSSLKSAINNAGWLIPRVPPPDTTDEFSEHVRATEETDEFSEILKPGDETLDRPPHVSDSDYDALRGGSFDTYANQNNDVYVAPPPSKSKIIREEDIIVAEIPSVKEVVEGKEGKLEVAGDQVAVKEVGPTIITSSTSMAKKQGKRTPQIIQADEMGSEGTIPLKMGAKVPEGSEKKSSYIVDDKTPRTISEDMTREEVHRITKVVNADESQDAQVVKTMKPAPRIKEVDGIILRKVDSPKDVSLKKVKSPKDMTITTKVGSGSIPVEDPTGRTVTATEPVTEETTQEPVTPPPPKDPDAGKKAAQRAASRKKSATQTQKKMEGEKKTTAKKTAKKKTTKKKTVVSKPVTVDSGKTDDYLLMLPEDWGQIHWVKKEKFIKEQTDIDFIKFILSVETTKAVQNACIERLKELGQGKSD